jgi:FkbM family methyltransferase
VRLVSGARYAPPARAAGGWSVSDGVMTGMARVVDRTLARMPRRVQDAAFELALRVAMIAGAIGVTSSARFALNELFLVRGVRRYQLRRSGRTLLVRHPMSDAWVVFEVVHRRVYVPPPPVEQALRRVATPRLVDLGAHIGATTLLLLEVFPSAHVVAVEPHPETAALLRKTIEVNGLDGQCELHEAAAGVEPGTAMMEGFSVLAHLVRADSEEAVDLFPPLRKYQLDGGAHVHVEVVDVLPLLAGADLVKMDIEGAEWPILQDPRFPSLGISALVLEYHSQGAPAGDITATVRAILSSAGFTAAELVEQDVGRGVIWAWRA